MKRVSRIAASLAVAATAWSLPGAAQTNVKDHPLVSRFQGSEVLAYKTSAFDEFVFALGPITAADAYTRSQRLEGKVTRFKYSQVPGRSGLEVIRNYQAALDKSGFQVLFKCDGKACISDKFDRGYTESASGDRKSVV